MLVVGTLEEPRAYTDREGNLRAALEVTADTIRFLSTRGESAAGATAPVPAGAGADAPAMSDEDIPF